MSWRNLKERTIWFKEWRQHLQVRTTLTAPTKLLFSSLGVYIEQFGSSCCWRLGSSFETSLLICCFYMLLRAGVPHHVIIKKLVGEVISRIEGFISMLSKLSRGTRVPLEYISYTDRHQRKRLLLHMVESLRQNKDSDGLSSAEFHNGRIYGRVHDVVLGDEGQNLYLQSQRCTTNIKEIEGSLVVWPMSLLK